MYATVLSPSDALRAYRLAKEMNQLGDDTVSASEGLVGTKSYDCLNEIKDRLYDVSVLGEIADLISISTKMQLAADEATVNRKLASLIPYSRQLAGHSRKVINRQAGRCGYDHRVNEKAREALEMLSEFDEILDFLQSKLAASGHCP